MKTLYGIAIILISLAVSGCGSTLVGSLKYSQPIGVSIEKSQQSNNKVFVSTFQDSRQGQPAGSTRIGKLAGAFNSTLSSIDLPQPVSVAVSDTINDFLVSAGVNSSRSQADGLHLSGNIKEFFCYFHFAHKAQINIDLTLTDSVTGKEVWQGTIKQEHIGSIFNRYPQVMEDPAVKCLGYDCHARGVNAAMNIMFSEGIAETWENGGLRAAIMQHGQPQ